MAIHRLPADGVRAGRRATGEHPAVRLPASDHLGGGEPSRVVRSSPRACVARVMLVDQTGAVLLIDAANVVGSRPTGWWRDRAGAARTFVGQVRAAVASERIARPVIVVLEGKAREGAEPGLADGVTVQHAVGSGDDMLVDIAGRASGARGHTRHGGSRATATGRGTGSRRGRAQLAPRTLRVVNSNPESRLSATSVGDEAEEADRDRARLRQVLRAGLSRPVLCRHVGPSFRPAQSPQF